MGYTITIDICSNCQSHKWCTRHEEGTYLKLAAELRDSITSNVDDVEVEVNKVGDLGGDRLGSFEVRCQGVTLFSKLALRYFPHTALLTNRIVTFLSDLK